MPVRFSHVIPEQTLLAGFVGISFWSKVGELHIRCTPLAIPVSFRKHRKVAV